MNHLNILFQKENLGEGAFGIVKKCFSSENPEKMYAVKMQGKYKSVKGGVVKALKNEIEIM